MGGLSPVGVAVVPDVAVEFEKRDQKTGTVTMSRITPPINQERDDLTGEGDSLSLRVGAYVRGGEDSVGGLEDFNRSDLRAVMSSVAD